MNDGDKTPSGIPRPVLAALSMMLGAAALAANHSLVRVVTEELHPLEASALRFLWARPIMLPWLLRGGAALSCGRGATVFIWPPRG